MASTGERKGDGWAGKKMRGKKNGGGRKGGGHLGFGGGKKICRRRESKGGKEKR